jgi:hypothetical protein
MKKESLVAFWSPYHGQTCTTSNLVALGTYIGFKYNIKTLLMHSQFKKSNLENAYFHAKDDIEAMLFDESGIDAIERLARTKQLSVSNFVDYTKTLLGGRLDILVGTEKSNEVVFQKILDTIQYILMCAKQTYDLVLCDVNSGTQNAITNKSLELADLIVVNLNQNVEVLGSFFNKEDWLEELDKKEHIILISNYDSNSKYSIKYIKRLFKCDAEIFGVSRNVHFMDHHNDHGVLRYFQGNYDVEKTDDNFEMMRDLDDISKYVLDFLKFDINLIDKPIDNKSITKKLLASVFKK